MSVDGSFDAPAPAGDVAGGRAAMAAAPDRAAEPARPETTVARMNQIGRLMLWSLTILLGLLGATACAALLWAAPGLGGWHPAAAPLRALILLTVLWGAWLFLLMFVIYDLVVPRRDFMYASLQGRRVHVGLTSYNDEQAVAETVDEFKAWPQVTKVCVADNNSRDGSFEAARRAGADSVVLEMVPGYGSCCMAAMAEAAKGLGPDDVIILCEGDMTFSAHDVAKLLAYLENADLVLGTRTTQELCETQTQMDWLINPGNQLMAKLTQVRFWDVRLTDVGCTYRAIRAAAYWRLRDRLTERGMMLDYQMALAAMKMRMHVVEIPIVFRQRVGESRGVGSNKLKALKATWSLLKMLYAA